MSRGRWIGWVLCLPLLFTTGCWDRKELNDRAIWLATGWDVGEKGGVKISGQIVIPSNATQEGGGNKGSMGKGYLTIIEEGKNVGDVLQKMQSELSREAFFGQRRVIFLGEEFAKQGLKMRLDGNTRESDVGIRTDIFVVKGGTAHEGLNPSSSVETPPARAALKKHMEVGGRGETAFLEFLIAANSDGIAPTLPAIEIVNPKKGPSKKLLRMAGVAVFDPDLTLLGYLNMDEDRDLLWIMGKLEKRMISVSIKEGNASLNLLKLKRKIVPEIRGNETIKMKVTLTGEGELFENNTNWNPESTKNLRMMEQLFEKQTEKQVIQTIENVQKKYGVDIFGFGEVVHRTYPQQWKVLKKDWHQHFSKADVSVETNLRITRIGLSGPSVLLNEGEIKE